MPTQTTIATIIEGNIPFTFKPKLEFYGKVKINKKRWGLIYKGKLEPTRSEIERISEVLNIPITAFFGQNQAVTI